MPTHNNYKSKWLAALKEGEDSPLVAAEKSSKVVQTIAGTNSNASIAITQIQQTALESAAVARSLIALLDESRSTAGLNFGTCGMTIDGKLSQMPLTVMLRRVRDVLKISESRIGILSVAADDLFKANTKLRHQIKSIEQSQSPLQRAIIESSWIGPRATTPEYDEFKDSKPGDFHRFGIKYDDLDDDWLDKHLVSNNQPGNGHESDDDSDSDDENSTQLVTRSSSHREIDLGL